MKTMRNILKNEEKERRRREQEMLCHMGRNTNTLVHMQEELWQAQQMNQQLNQQHMNATMDPLHFPF